jgi:hypothetical protein
MNRNDINKKNLKRILNWCKDYYGESKFKNINTLKIYIDDTMDSAGAYCTSHNAIFINTKVHRSFIDVINTMIHEYTHFRQDIKVMYFKYLKVYSFNYENHPYEITARETAERDKRKCFRDVFHKCYNKGLS